MLAFYAFEICCYATIACMAWFLFAYWLYAVQCGDLDGNLAGSVIIGGLLAVFWPVSFVMTCLYGSKGGEKPPARPVENDKIERYNQTI